ncbi:helix-turn-helix domain-containing protein [Streptomyces sp. NPDC037389]|uniref:helix-turn-helix domain-containing protein n=1 Tax=Streptomyces sp. NPDC037389 TaxID=3155369 RepID=UPI0033EDB843
MTNEGKPSEGPQYPAGSGPPAAGESLADKLDRLFKIVHPKDRGPYSTDEVAAELKKRGGPTVSGTYLWQLRTGRRNNPTKHHLEALAGFFKVPVAYFFDDDLSRRLGAQLELLQGMQEAGVEQVAFRAVGLSPKGMDVVVSMIEKVRELEGLPAAESNHPDG